MIETEISQDQVPALPENPVSNFQFSRKDVVLLNGNNDNIPTEFYNYLRVTGPSAAFAMRGFAGGIRGAILYVEIDIAQTVTLANLSSGSLPGNRIITGTGADVSMATPCVLQFVYNDDSGAWFIVGKQPTNSEVPHTHIDGETPSGAIDGANVTFALAATPNPATSLQLFLNGLRVRAGAGNDYTLSGATITMATAPASGDTLIADYRTS